MKPIDWSRLKKIFAKKPPKPDILPSLLSSAGATLPVTSGDQSDTPIVKSSESLSFVSRLKDLKLTDFITCCVDNDLQPIVLSGQPDEEQLSTAWLQLLSQYYEARQDARANEHRELLAQLETLKIRAAVIDMLVEAHKCFASPLIAERLREMGYVDLQLTNETMDNDLMCIRNNEVNYQIQYDDIKEALDNLSKGMSDKDGKPTTAHQKSFYDYVMSYNEAFKTTYTVDGLNTFEYALICHRLDEYINDLNTQNRKTHAG